MKIVDGEGEQEEGLIDEGEINTVEDEPLIIEDALANETRKKAKQTAVEIARTVTKRNSKRIARRNAIKAKENCQKNAN